MNVYVKRFLHRGMLFGGFGPIIAGVVHSVLDHTIPNFALSGAQVLLAVVSTYVLAFVQAGASVFNQIEEWSVPKSLLCHFSALYVVYVLCYLVNTWIPFEPLMILLFTAVFAGIYLVIWLTVYISIKVTSRRLNAKLK